MAKLTLRTAGIVRRLGQLAGSSHGPYPPDNLQGLSTKLLAQLDPCATPRTAVPHVANGDVQTEHLLQTKGLGAELQVRRPPVPHSRLVLHRGDSVPLHFDSVRSARQPMSFRPKRNRAKHEPPALLAMASAVDAAVSARSLHRVCIVGPHPVTVNQCTLLGTVGVVLDRRDRNGRDRAQSRSDPRAAVLSACARCKYLTHCHPARTPTRPHVLCTPGFHTSNKASIADESRLRVHAGHLKRRPPRPSSAANHPRCIATTRSWHPSRRSTPSPRTGRIARPKKAKISTTGSTRCPPVLSANDPNLV